jgi:hypothetical protein
MDVQYTAILFPQRRNGQRRGEQPFPQIAQIEFTDLTDIKS